jgi:hypothetical protein
MSVGTAPAQADRDIHKDARKDVTKIVSVGDGERVESIDTLDTSADITRTVVTHGPRRVRIAVKLRDLRAATDALITVYLRTPRVDYMIFLFRGPKGHAVASLENPNLEDTRCRGMRASVSLRRDRYVASVPRRCLGRPRWVQAMIQASYLDYTGDPGSPDFTVNYHVDDARLDGKVAVAFGPGSRKGYTPRLYRG